MIRVLLVDDQTLFREGVRLLLDDTPDIEVVGGAGDGLEAIDAVDRLRPDVVLMDIRMPALDGVAATRRILTRHPETRVVALTTFDDDRLIFDILREGAAGYLLKDAEAAQMIAAIRVAASGQSVLTPAVATKVVSEFARMARMIPVAGAADLGLTPRELQVVRLLVRGASNKEIAGALFVAEGTVKNHLSNIFRKLDVTDRVQAAVKAMSHGIG